MDGSRPSEEAALRRPTGQEAAFELHELFYSRTDPRGVIQSGNDIFQRVSAYDWAQLIGAPHKIIRHPDMPRAVFWLLWDRVKRGRPIGAYVKNRTADGLHYWVFACVTPIEGGFLSVRIKPSSPLFATVRAEYATLRKAESDPALTPEASADALIARIRELGFANYEHFMASAATEEMTARDAALGRPPDPLPPLIWQIAERLEQADREIADLVAMFATIRMMPTNMRIAASRIEPAGGPISAISENYRMMAHEVIAQLAELAPQGRPVTGPWLETVYDAAFLHCVARLQEETVRQTEAVAPGDHTKGRFDEVTETGMLLRQMHDYREKAHRAFGRVVEEIARLPPLCAGLRRSVVALDAVRRSCRVENSWLDHRGGGLTSIIEQLDSFHHDTDGRLDRITQHAVAISALLRKLDRRRNMAHHDLVQRAQVTIWAANAPQEAHRATQDGWAEKAARATEAETEGGLAVPGMPVRAGSEAPARH